MASGHDQAARGANRRREGMACRAPDSAGVGRHLGRRRKSARTRSAGLVALHVAGRSLPWVSLTNSLEVKSFSHGEAESIFRIYLGAETVEKHRDALLEFAERMERLPIAIVVGADMLRRELDPVPEAARGLRLERLRNEVHDVAALLRRAITARPKEQLRLLNAMAVCALEGFWFPLTVEIAGLTEAEGRAARNKLVDASLLRMLDRDRQRFQLHALLREELQNLAPLGALSSLICVLA